MSRADIIGEVSASNLRGRGGAGFPTGTKWNLAAAAQVKAGGRKYVVCNADEGEPGTFKDRVILAEHADLVFEGMTIAARAIGASTGILYLRGEYVYLRPHLEEVLEKRRDQKLLGDDIGGLAGFNFDIHIHMGAGAYVCGEETALIESLEGNRGEPRNRPPFPVDTGFKGQPTVVNNVETLAWVACIMSRSAHWFTLRRDREVHRLQAVQRVRRLPRAWRLRVPAGDHGGGTAPQGRRRRREGRADRRRVRPLPPGLRVLAVASRSRTSPRAAPSSCSGPTATCCQVARNFMEFFVEESCGQCTPCRAGNAKLLEGIEMLERGECSMAYLQELLALSETMQLASKCGLGQSSPNAFVSIVRHFKDEIMGRSFVA